MHRYAFKTVKPADLAMLREWLAEPHIRLWWGDPETRLERMIEAMDRPDVTQLIALCNKIPFAYLEHYDVHARGRVHQTTLPPGTRAIEAFVGVSAMMWKGHGTAVLHRLCVALDRRGIPTLSADLDVSNNMARHVYVRIGFVEQHLVDTPEGQAVLMLRKRGVMGEVTAPC